MCVPTTLPPLAVAVAPWSSNRSVPTSATPLMSDILSLGGVLGLSLGGVVFWVEVSPGLGMGTN